MCFADKEGVNVQSVELLRDLESVCIKTLRSEIGSLQVPSFVVDYGTNLTVKQKEWYVNTATSFYELLSDDQDTSLLAKYRLVFYELLKVGRRGAFLMVLTNRL